MAFSRSVFLIGTTALLTLTGCGSPVNKNIEFGGQYWQRVSVSEAVYMRGPKAQQMLNRDIARCVAELRELERLGAVKNAIPTDMTGRVLDPDDGQRNADEMQLEDWDTPERDKHLYAEHSDYHDFEGCMLSNGWERTLHVPYDVADEARDNYRKAHIDYKYESRIGKKHTKMTKPEYTGSDYQHINE